MATSVDKHKEVVDSELPESILAEFENGKGDDDGTWAQLPVRLLRWR